MIQKFICCDCEEPCTQEHEGGRKRIRCVSCAEKKNRERSKKWNRKNRAHKKQDHPSIPYRQYHDYEEDRVPLIPPAERLRLAQERKMEDWTLEHRAAFLNGSGGRQFMREIP